MFEFPKYCADQMGIVSAKVVDEHWDFVGQSQLKVAIVMCGPSVLSSQMVVVADLFFWIVKAFSTDVAVCCGAEIFLIGGSHVQSSVIEEELQTSFRYCQDSIEEPLDDIRSAVAFVKELYFRQSRNNFEPS